MVRRSPAWTRLSLALKITRTKVYPRLSCGLQISDNQKPQLLGSTQQPLGLARGGLHAYFPAMASFEDIKADFEFLEDWDDRYKYLIDLGRNLTPYPEQFRDDAHKVRGCASQVWLHAERKSGIITLEGDSDAHIVKGLVALLIALYSGKSGEAITATNPQAALAPFDLDSHLTPQRSNGLHAMVKFIQRVAKDETDSLS